MLLWVSGITVLEATAALSYCCNSNSLGSTEMGFSNSPGGNPLKFKSDSHQFLTSVWSRRTPCQPPASKARYSPWAPLPMNYTRRKWKRERERELSKSLDSIPLCLMALLWHSCFLQAWLPFWSIRKAWGQASALCAKDTPEFYLQKNKARILFAEQTPKENKNGAFWQGAWTDRSLVC